MTARRPLSGRDSDKRACDCLFSHFQPSTAYKPSMAKSDHSMRFFEGAAPDFSNEH